MAFWHGLLLAFGLILPLGVQNVFIFNQGAMQPRLTRALPAVLMATVCDILLISLAVLGVSVIVLSVSVVRYILLGVGVIFLLYMGVMTWRSAASSAPQTAAEETAASSEADVRILSPKKQMMFAASVSLLNPHAILDTVGVIGTSSLQYAGADKVLFATACMLVSLLWFLSLACAGRIVGRINNKLLPLINRISAVIMWISAVVLVKSLL